MTEVEAVIHSRPSTVEAVSDSGSLIPISPNKMLTMKTSAVIFKERIYTVRKDRDVFSTLQMNFGQDGENNS